MADGEVEVPLETGTTETKPVDIVLDGKKNESGKETPAVVSAEEGVESIKAQLARNRQEMAARIAQADQAVANARQEADQAKRESVVAKASTVETVMDGLEKEKKGLIREYRLANESGDHEKVAEINFRISEIAARLVDAERGKVALEEQARTPVRRVEQQQQLDPAEALARTLSPKSAEWVRAHPEFARDNRKLQLMVRADEDARYEGHDPDSDNYFAFVNERLGVNKRQQEDDGGRQRSREDGRAPIAAPVGRDVGAQTAGRPGPRTVRLTASEQDTAKALDMSLQDYAKYKLELIAEGKIAAAG